MSLIFHRSDGEIFEYDGTNLYHFGIKGMKWGVRRFQNEDGSLTPAGKTRYLKLKKKYDKANKGYKKWKGESDKSQRQLDWFNKNYKQWRTLYKETGAKNLDSALLEVLTPIGRGAAGFNKLTYDAMANSYAKKSSRYLKEMERLKNQNRR